MKVKISRFKICFIWFYFRPIKARIDRISYAWKNRGWRTTSIFTTYFYPPSLPPSTFITLLICSKYQKTFALVLQLLIFNINFDQYITVSYIPLFPFKIIIIATILLLDVDLPWPLTDKLTSQFYSISVITNKHCVIFSNCFTGQIVRLICEIRQKTQWFDFSR